MTQQLKALLDLMEFGEMVIESEPEWDIKNFRKKFSDYLLPNMDDWECAVTSFCVGDLMSHVLENGDMPKSIQINDPGDPGPAVMERYMQIAWSYVSHEMFGEDTPLRYATAT